MSDFNFDFLNADAVETADTLPAPITYTRRVGKRRYLDGLKKQALSDLIPELPPTDTDLYLLSNGSGGTFRAKWRRCAPLAVSPRLRALTSWKQAQPA